MSTRRRWLESTAAIGFFAAGPVLAQSESPVRIGSNLGDGYAEAYFAKEAGYYQKVGLNNVDLPIINQGGTMVAAVAGGTLDIAITTTVSIANAYFRKIPLAIIAPGEINVPGAPSSPIVVARHSPFQQPRDFVGKTIALNGLRAITEVTLDAWLTKGGVDPASVKILEITFAEMGQAIARGTVDAALLAEPFLSVALKANDLRILVDPALSIARELLVSAWFTSNDFARRRPDVVKRFTALMALTARWANTHHTETANILAKYTKLDPEILKTMLRAQYAERLRPADLQPTLDAAAKFGVLPGAVSASALFLQS